MIMITYWECGRGNMILHCDGCEFVAQLPAFDFMLAENTARVACPKCGEESFGLRIAFKCLDCGAQDFKPIDRSTDNHRHWHCSVCGSLKIGYL